MIDPKNGVSLREYKRAYDARRKNTHKRVHLTLTLEDYQIFEQLAHDLGTSPAKAISHLAKSGADLVPAPIPKSTRDFLRECIVTLRRTGRVFNQCAKHWHRKSYIPENQKPLWIENCEFLARFFLKIEKAIMNLGESNHRHDP